MITGTWAENKSPLSTTVYILVLLNKSFWGGLAEKFTDSIDLQAPEAPPLGDGHPEEISVISEKTIRTMWFFIHYCFQKPCQNICEENKRVIHAQQCTLGKAVSPGWIEAGSLPAPSVRLY